MKNQTTTVSLLAVITLLVPGLAGAQQGAFRWPVSVALGGTPEILVVSENARHRINVHDLNGALIVRVGSQGVGDGQFNNPVGVAVDAQGFIYVADMGNSRVQKFDRSGNFVTKWGSPGTGQGQFRKPRAIAVDAQNNVSVLDSETGKIQKFSPNGAAHLGSWGGSFGTGDGQFSPLGGGPADLVIDSTGVAYVTDTANHRVQKWQVNSNATGSIQNATFQGWSGGCTSGSQCDVSVGRSREFNCRAATCSPASQGSHDGQFINPLGVARDAAGNLYVTDQLNDRVQQFGSTGSFIQAWGRRGSMANEFRQPGDAAVSTGRDLFVADTLNQRVLKFSNMSFYGQVIGGGIALTASVGYPPQILDALVDPNTLFLFPGGTASTTLRVTSLNEFAGPVTFTLTAPGCCEDYVSRAWLPGAVSTAFAPPTVPVPAGNFVESALTITAPASAAPRRVLISVGAGNQQLGVGDMVGVVAEILPPIPRDRGALPPCVSRFVLDQGGFLGTGTTTILPEVLPVSTASAGLYTQKAGSPSTTSYALGVGTALQGRGFAFGVNMNVAKATSPLRSNQAVVVFTNSSGLDKEIRTVNSANCGAAPQSILVAPNQSTTFMISTADTTTLLLREKYCATWFLGCWQYDFRPRAIFDDAAFWSLFGGRQVTLDWFQ
jgi:hypothetical protein